MTALMKWQRRSQSLTESLLPNLKEQFSQQLKQEVQLLTSQLSQVLSHDIVRPSGNVGLIKRVSYSTYFSYLYFCYLFWSVYIYMCRYPTRMLLLKLRILLCEFLCNMPVSIPVQCLKLWLDIRQFLAIFQAILSMFNALYIMCIRTLC